MTVKTRCQKCGQKGKVRTDGVRSGWPFNCVGRVAHRKMAVPIGAVQIQRGQRVRIEKDGMAYLLQPSHAPVPTEPI
jgi:hypothetical protein